MPPTGNLARTPGMCPDWELKEPPCGFQPVLNLLSYTSQGYRQFFLKKDFIYVFLDTGEGREKEREKNIDVQEKYQPVARTGNRTSNLSVLRLAFSPLNQGPRRFLTSKRKCPNL